MAQQTTGERVRTVSLVFEEVRYDERRFSRLATERLQTEHTEIVLSAETILRDLEQSLAAYDQPSMDGTNTFFVAKYTRGAHLKVALSGVGGDELFGG